MAFRIWVNAKTNCSGGYLKMGSSLPLVTPWKERASTFVSKDSASEMITALGWANDTSVRSHRTTAYVVGEGS